METRREEEIEEAATVDDGGSARADCRGRGNGREGEKGSQRGRDGVSSQEVAEDLTHFQIPRLPTGRTLRRNKVADGDHGRGLVDNGEDGDGEDGRRSRRVGEEETEREGRRSSSETVAQVNGGRGERRERRESASRIKPRQLREMGRDEENGGDGAGAQRG